MFSRHRADPNPAEAMNSMMVPRIASEGHEVGFWGFARRAGGAGTRCYDIDGLTFGSAKKQSEEIFVFVMRLHAFVPGLAAGQLDTAHVAPAGWPDACPKEIVARLKTKFFFERGMTWRLYARAVVPPWTGLPSADDFGGRAVAGRLVFPADMAARDASRRVSPAGAPLDSSGPGCRGPSPAAV